jgi:hypothetical protein
MSGDLLLTIFVGYAFCDGFLAGKLATVHASDGKDLCEYDEGCIRVLCRHLSLTRSGNRVASVYSVPAVRHAFSQPRLHTM